MVKVEVSFPSIVDWCYAEAFVQFLERFYEATLKFSCYKKVTANAPFQEMINIASGLDATMTSDDLFMRRVTQSKKLKFDKYWGNSKEMNKLIFVAIILDPRYKLDYLTFGLDLLHKDAKEIEELTRDVRTILMRLYESYTPNNLDVGQTNSNVMVEESEGGIDGRKNPALFAYVNKMKDKHVVFISNEIDKYLGELAQDPMNLTFDLLMWWKENSSRFPILSKVAKDIFAVSVSSVASEAAFSAGKRVVDPFHACLTTKTVEALIFTNDWLKGEAFNYFKAPSDDDIDFFKNLENVEKEISMIAENIMDVG